MLVLGVGLFGQFWALLPDNFYFEQLFASEHLKVTLEEPAGPFPKFSNFPARSWIDFPAVAAVKIENVPDTVGVILDQAGEYLDLKIWNFGRYIEKEGEILRFLLCEGVTEYPLHVPTGKEVQIVYEIDEAGNRIALLIAGFVG